MMSIDSGLLFGATLYVETSTATAHNHYFNIAFYNFLCEYFHQSHVAIFYYLVLLYVLSFTVCILRFSFPS